ncbi:MAG: hypothetical protein LQ343_000945 [Gyalolechia ehrenbergii]|nr:MAG: hypothetical protein LQ343_000945 [Gyalolechia ehrenbergii]
MMATISVGSAVPRVLQGLEVEKSWTRVTYTLLSWFKPPLPPFAFDAEAAEEVAEDTEEYAEAIVGVADGASSEMDEDAVEGDVEGDRMLLTRLAAIGA